MLLYLFLNVLLVLLHLFFFVNKFSNFPNIDILFSNSFKNKSNLELNNFFPSKITSLEKLKKFLKKINKLYQKKIRIIFYIKVIFRFVKIKKIFVYKKIILKKKSIFFLSKRLKL